MVNVFGKLKPLFVFSRSRSVRSLPRPAVSDENVSEGQDFNRTYENILSRLP